MACAVGIQPATALKRGNRSSWASFSMLFAYFVYITHLTKFTRGGSLFMEKSLLVEKSQVEESPW